jgi:RNA recognition motif-containing protein
VTSDEFRSFFEQFGSVVDSVVMFDRITTRSRGFGFVTFEDPACCSRLLGFGRVEMRGKWVEIKSAEPKSTAGSGETRRYDNTNHAASPQASILKNANPTVDANFDHASMFAPSTPCVAPFVDVPPPPPFCPINYICSSPMMPPAPVGTVPVLRIGAYYTSPPLTPFELNGAYYTPAQDYPYPNMLNTGAYGYVPYFYPDPYHPDSAMQTMPPPPVTPFGGVGSYEGRN